MKKYTKNLVLCVGPASAGKNTASMNISECCAPYSSFIDKDDIAAKLSTAAFQIAGQPVNRQSAWFRDHLRRPEVDALEELLKRMLLFSKLVISPCPYSSEMEAELQGTPSSRLQALKRAANARDAALVIVYCNISTTTAKERWLKRAAEDPDGLARTPEAIANLEKTLDEKAAFYGLPADTTILSADYFYLFDANEPQVYKSFEELKKFLRDEVGVRIESDLPYDPDICKRTFYGAAQAGSTDA